MSPRQSFATGAPAASAAPAGGTFGCRGCLLALALLAAPVQAKAQSDAQAPARTDEIAVPSGLAVAFHDVIRDVLGDGLTYRFRFVAPGIGAEGAGFMDVAPDMEHLCNAFALPRVPHPGPQPNRIVITLMSEPVEFGAASPETTQFFESYSLSDGLCIWEVF